MSGQEWDALLGRCVREAARIVGPDDAPDAVQEALLRAWRSCRRGVAPRFPAAWLLRIVRNEALRRRAQRPETTAIDEQRDPADHRALQRLDDIPLRVDVRRAVGQLPPDDRKLIALRYVDDLTQTGVAAELGIPEGTAKVRLHRIRKRLQAVLADEPGARG
ncbi:MAG TPA: sigma-70 family RNA polymerase sigma factor [Baekduia sp.]|nr:sigma-70 family RNA polymerase sigma factor [Baekduia sp.]